MRRQTEGARTISAQLIRPPLQSCNTSAFLASESVQRSEMDSLAERQWRRSIGVEHRPVRRGRGWAELVQRNDDLSADMASSQNGQVLWNLVQRYNLRNCRTDLVPVPRAKPF